MGIRVYGSSDDLVEIEGDVREELNVYDQRVVVTIGDERTGAVRVRAEYAPRGSGAVWRLSVEQLEEDIPAPWPVRVEPQHGYSMAVQVDCPPGTPVVWLREESA